MGSRNPETPGFRNLTFEGCRLLTSCRLLTINFWLINLKGAKSNCIDSGAVISGYLKPLNPFDGDSGSVNLYVRFLGSSFPDLGLKETSFSLTCFNGVEPKILSSKGKNEVPCFFSFGELNK
ncbi:MAG TPA: hypothetical protein VN414_08020 [Methanosarcina sp.]|nr:hypothetical protein [Methanosarcina sp.]